MIEGNLYKWRSIIGRTVYIFIFLTLMVRYYLHATPSSMLEPVLFRYNFDYTYWAFDLLGLINNITRSKTGSIIFDMLMLSSCFLCILFPAKYYISIVFGCLYLCYAVLFNTFILHHAHSLAVITLITVPFFFKKNEYWYYLWQGMRYYVCYVYFISFIWKIRGGSFFYWSMGENSTKGNLVQYLYEFPENYIAGLYRFFLQHPNLLNAGFLLICLLEAIMAVGFFTKKYDRMLFVIPFVIHLSTYIFSDVFFIEMLIGSLTFINLIVYENRMSRFQLSLSTFK